MLRPTVFKRKGRKSWVCRFGPANKTQMTFKTRGAAEDHKSKLTGQPTPTDPGLYNVTVKDFGERWLATKREQAATGNGLRRRTIKGYAFQFEHHVLPAFASCKVRELHQRDVLLWLREKFTGGLKVSSLRSMIAPLMCMLHEAVFSDIVSGNVASLAWRSFRKEIKVRREDATVKAIPAEDVDAIVAAASPRYRPLFATMAGTGIRPGEAYGAQIEDVDLIGTRGILHVKHTLGIPEAGLSPQDRLGSAKTDAGVRDVQLSTATAALLSHHIAQRKAENLANGWTSPWLFVSSRGTPFDHSVVDRELKAALKAAGKSSALTPHAFRHSWASRMLAAGVPLTWVSGQLGHSTPAFTMRVYAHAMPKAGDGYADRIDPPAQSALQEAVGDHPVTTGARIPLKSGVSGGSRLAGVQVGEARR